MAYGNTNGWWFPAGGGEDVNTSGINLTLAIATSELLVAPAAGYTQETANGTYTLKSGPGVFYGATVTVAGSADTVTVYDNTSGSGTVLVPSTSIASAGPVTTNFPTGIGVRFTLGLTVVMAGTTSPTILFFWS